MSSLRRLLLAQVQATPHTELNYLRGSTTTTTSGQYINTGIGIKSTLKIELKFRVVSQSGDYGFFGGRLSGQSNLLVRFNNNTQFASDYGAARYYTSITPSINEEITLIKDKNLTYINGTLASTANIATFSVGANVFMFMSNNNGVPSSLASNISTTDIFYCKIWDNDVLVRDLIPVLKTDGTYCLYDKVSGTYFLNQGAGSFTGA